MLSHEQCETVHRASLEILRRTGVRAYHDEALALLRETDAVLTDDLQRPYALFRKSSTF
jgi:trimethylamine:corrinoid methyltransferase-like protein